MNGNFNQIRLTPLMVVAVVGAFAAFPSWMVTYDTWREYKPEDHRALRFALTLAASSTVVAALGFWFTRRNWICPDGEDAMPSARPFWGLLFALGGIAILALAMFLPSVQTLLLIKGSLIFVGGCSYAVTGQWK
jgi:hypothetical protein